MKNGWTIRHNFKGITLCVLDDFFPFSRKNWILGYSLSTLLWYRCYNPHRSRDALSPVCRIFFNNIYFWRGWMLFKYDFQDIKKIFYLKKNSTLLSFFFFNINIKFHLFCTEPWLSCIDVKVYDKETRDWLLGTRSEDE